MRFSLIQRKPVFKNIGNWFIVLGFLFVCFLFSMDYTSFSFNRIRNKHLSLRSV